MGVNSFGDLNYSGVGLVYLPTGADALINGIKAEGWGVADSQTGVAGYANVDEGTSSNLATTSFTSSDSTAASVVDIGTTFEVTQDIRPLLDGNDNVIPDVYQLAEYITNLSSAPVHLLYRRSMDWDIWPTRYNEFVTNSQGSSVNPEVVYDNNDGFVKDNPLGPRTSGGIVSTGVPDLFQTGTFTQSGPGDIGAMFDFDFGTLAAHATQTFTLYYGATGGFAAAQSQVSSLNLATYSIAQPDAGDSESDGDGDEPPPDLHSNVADSDDQPDSGHNAFFFGYAPGGQISVDMNVDANNDGTINASDEPIKDDPTKPGNVIIADTLDQNGNHKPGYADLSDPINGYTPESGLGAIDLSTTGLSQFLRFGQGADLLRLFRRRPFAGHLHRDPRIGHSPLRRRLQRRDAPMAIVRQRAARLDKRPE